MEIRNVKVGVEMSWRDDMGDMWEESGREIVYSGDIEFKGYIQRQREIEAESEAGEEEEAEVVEEEEVE